MTSSAIRILEQDIPSGRVMYALLPPHHPRHFTSVTERGGIGASFTAHRLAVRAVEGAPLREGDIAAGDAFIMSSGNLEWLSVAEPSEMWEFHPDPSFVERIASELGASRPVSLPDIDGRQDAVIWSIATWFRSRLARGQSVETLDASERLRALVAHAAQVYGGVVSRRQRAGTLDARRLTRVVEYVDAHLGDGIALEQLAEVAALSPFHFARCLRATLHLTPHQFVTARRMERARQLLLTTRLSTSDVASRVGYRNVAHFREQFVAAFALRPSESRAGASGT
jgi:AraC family transcriptional regulator